jgi:septum formation protein
LFLKSPPALILASTSPYRRALLERLRLPFSALSPGVDETPRAGETADALVARLARAKAAAIAVAHPEAWVIGSDQTAVLADRGGVLRMLGKPGDAPQCIRQLQDCSGRTVSFLTAVALLREGAGGHEFTVTTRVRFRTLDRATIERYVEAESPLDCAGGFKSEGLGIALCESIEGDDPSALIGLPLIRLAALLRQVGLQVP